MIKKTISILFLFSVLLLLAFNTFASKNETGNFQLVAGAQKFIAGNPIRLAFRTDNYTLKPQLFIIHSYGRTLIEGKLEINKYIFEIPETYSKKTGLVSWFLINNGQKEANGTFEILPNDKTKTYIENYMGPPSILAGGTEFTMMVTVPTDSYDNPKLDSTKVILKTQFLQNINAIDLKTKNFVSWHRIYSPLKSGKLVIATQTDTIVTKETVAQVYPNIPADFNIFYEQNHDFADGNEVTNIYTSIIKDKFNNIVSDGTTVTFIVKNSQNRILKTFGATIRGIASGQVLHPDHPETFSIKGYVTGISESNSINVVYKPMITDFKYNFKNNNRTLIVGELKSFMNQLVPDGIKVTVKVFNNNKLIATLQEYTAKGYATFDFKKDFFKNYFYHFEISTLGVTKTTSTIEYEL
jgi:hypothetical protein